jgi:hypothetical protein
VLQSPWAPERSNSAAEETTYTEATMAIAAVIAIIIILFSIEIPSFLIAHQGPFHTSMAKTQILLFSRE